MRFGKLAIAANDTASRFNFPRSGNNISIEGQFVLIASGLPGLFRFSGFPPTTRLNVSLTDTTLTAETFGVTEPLSVDNYDFPQVTTDSEGNAEMSLGARLGTTGNGGAYEDYLYSGTSSLRVNYWQPDANAYVSNSKVIFLETELSSTLTINQEQQLHFGTLFARSSATGQATMTVSPAGTYKISQPENARMVSIVEPEEGVLRVSGAAANYTLSVDPQVADVLLEHTDNPTGSPHFILSDLLTSPDGTGRTDANGEMLIKIGGTLKTEITSSPKIYPSGQYEGTYEITVSY